MKCVATVLVTFLGLVAWAGNGVERDMIDFGNTILSLELKSRLNEEVAQAFPQLVEQKIGSVARLDSMQVGSETNAVVYEFALIVNGSAGPQVLKIVVREGITSPSPQQPSSFEVLSRELKGVIP